jgi:hypothetical protein
MIWRISKLREQTYFLKERSNKINCTIINLFGIILGKFISKKQTWQLPWLMDVQIHLYQCSTGQSIICDLLLQIMTNKLLITRVKPEPWWKCRLYLP